MYRSLEEVLSLKRPEHLMRSLDIAGLWFLSLDDQENKLKIFVKLIFLISMQERQGQLCDIRKTTTYLVFEHRERLEDTEHQHQSRTGFRYISSQVTGVTSELIGQRILTLLESKMTLTHLPSKFPSCSWESLYLSIPVPQEKTLFFITPVKTFCGETINSIN